VAFEHVYYQGCQISNRKAQFGQILECPAMKDVSKFYGHVVYFTSISYILWPFGAILVYFFRFGMLHQEKSGNTVYHMSIDWFGLLLYFHFVFDNF
jgi:uncharacterized membrane protein YagU involved in acid resistance